MQKQKELVESADMASETFVKSPVRAVPRRGEDLISEKFSVLSD